MGERWGWARGLHTAWQRARGRWVVSALVVGVLVGCAGTPGKQPVSAPTEPPVAKVPKPVRLGLALGGGAARGFAHVGVIQALEEAGIKPSLVVGTSAGSLVAALYASGQTGSQLQQTALAMEEAAITDWTLPIFSRGVLRGEALAKYVGAQVGGRLIEQMPLPLGIVATDLASGEGILFRRGDTATAVRASSAVPAVFQPVKIGAREYVDGGLVAPVPVGYARQMGADVVLAVDISSMPNAQATNDNLAVLLQTFAIMGHSINGHELRGADVVVRPALGDMKGSDFSGRMRAIEMGRTAMRQMLGNLKQAIELKRGGG